MLSVSFSTMIPVSKFRVLEAYEAYVEVVEEVGFKQKRTEGVPVSGPMLCEKAVELSKGLHGEGATFSASEGWKWLGLVPILTCYLVLYIFNHSICNKYNYCILY